jgi:hypothetical protein
MPNYTKDDAEEKLNKWLLETSNVHVISIRRTSFTSNPGIYYQYLKDGTIIVNYIKL